VFGRNSGFVAGRAFTILAHAKKPHPTRMSPIQPEAILYATPLLVLLGLGLALMLLDAFKLYRWLPWVAGVGMAIGGGLAWPGFIQPETANVYYSGMISFGGIHGLVTLFLSATGVFSVFFLEDYLRRHDQKLGDVYGLMVFAVIGMILLATANDMILVFIGLEVMSVALYIMAGLFKRDQGSNESGLKYFLLGAFSTGFFLYGIALLYGITGFTRLDSISGLDSAVLVQNWMFYPAFGLLLIGFLFKIAAFPFHSWTPDVYTGTPTPLAGFMATGSKMAALISLSIFLIRVLPNGGSEQITLLIIIFSVLSMIYGNVVATQQKNVKRMLAYSSIAHTGYLLLGIATFSTAEGGQEGYEAVIFYMFIYTLMTIGAFGVVSALESKAEDTDLENWKGLGLKYPWLGAAMSVFLFSLAGIPPLAGFMSKYQVFLAAIDSKLVVWATIGILTSVIGAYYYIRVIVYMYFYKPDAATVDLPIRRLSLTPVVGVLVLGALLVLFGVYPGSVIDYIEALAQPAVPIEAVTSTLP
jgi:NADH-quinone oxidoreductase subunit N